MLQLYHLKFFFLYRLKFSLVVRLYYLKFPFMVQLYHLEFPFMMWLYLKLRMSRLEPS
jgi:hypothetical protein